MTGQKLKIPTKLAWPPQYRIEPTSCMCGGNYAWLQKRETGAWEMVGCICHHTPAGAIGVTLEVSV